MDYILIVVALCPMPCYTATMKRIKKADGFENQYLFVFPSEFLNEYHLNPLFTPFRVTDIGYFPSAQNHYRERNKGCPEAILFVCHKGYGAYNLNDAEPVDISPGQVFVLPPDVPHRYAANEKTPWSVYWLHFTGSNALALCSFFMEQQPIAISHAFIAEILRLFYHCFDLLKKPYHMQEYYVVCQYALSIIATLLLAGKQARLNLTEKGDLGIQSCIEFMHANLHAAVTLEQLSSVSGFSPSHLNALFKSATNHSPMDYFLHMKMQAASKELFFSDRLVKDIAAQFGIWDSCYFSRIFKRVMGMSPIAYRQLMKG